MFEMMDRRMNVWMDGWIDQVRWHGWIEGINVMCWVYGGVERWMNEQLYS